MTRQTTNVIYIRLRSNLQIKNKVNKTKHMYNEHEGEENEKTKVGWGTMFLKASYTSDV